MRSLVLALLCVSLGSAKIAIYSANETDCAVLMYTETFNLTMGSETVDLSELDPITSCSVTNISTSIDLDFEDKLGTNYTNATLSFKFSQTDTGYWQSESISMSFSNSSGAVTVEKSFREVDIISKQFSFACSLLTQAKISDELEVTLDYYQMQVYGVDSAVYNGTETLVFDEAAQCVAILSEGTWMGIITTLLLIVVLVFSIMMLLSTSTPDRFETSKSKCLIIPHEH